MGVFTSYFSGFDLVFRDAEGIENPLVNFTLTIREVGGSNIATVESDDNGFIFGGEIDTGALNQPIEFYDASATYAGVLAQISQATILEAAVKNKVHRFIIDDAYSETTEATHLDIFAQDLADEAIAPVKLGTIAPGETLLVPFESYYLKNLRIFKVQYDAENAQSQTDLELADSEDFSPDATRPEDKIIIDDTAIEGGTVGKGLYHKTGHVIGEFDIPTGTVTSVGVTVPSFLSASGSPVTASGTIAVSLANQTGNTIFASPSGGGSGAPTFRSLVAADIPSLDGAKITSGTIDAARLGSGSSVTTKFLRGDNTWQTVSASPAGSSGDIQYNNAGSFAGAPINTDGTVVGLGTASIYYAKLMVAGNLTAQDVVVAKYGHATPTGSSAFAIYSSAGGLLSRWNAYGSNNNFIGTNAGNFTLSGTENVGIGSNLMASLTTGNYNVALGSYALNSITSGNSNFGMGFASLSQITSASFNVAVGSSAASSTVGAGSVAIGNQAGEKFLGNYQTFIGISAGRWMGATSGDANVCIGASSGENGGATAQNNTFIGANSGANATGSSSVLIGCQAGYNATGSTNILIGYQAGYSETGSNKLYIANSNTATPLIYGEFDTGIFKIHSGSSVRIHSNGTGLGFFGTTPAGQQTITGVTEQQQIDSIVDALSNLGLVVDGR